MEVLRYTPREAPEFWTWSSLPSFYNCNTIGPWWSESIIPASRIIFFTYWLRDMKTPKWPGSSLIFQFNGNIGVYPKGIILPFKPVQKTIVGMGGKNSARRLLYVIVRGDTALSTPWFFDPRMLAVNERAPNISYWSKQELSFIRENPILLVYCILTGTVTWI